MRDSEKVHYERVYHSSMRISHVYVCVHTLLTTCSANVCLHMCACTHTDIQYAYEPPYLTLRCSSSPGSQGDMVAVTHIVDWVSRIFEKFDYKWLTREMNENLPKELDFMIEASNLVRAADCLKPLIEVRKYH